ncbi:hypothetical protein R1sor_021669 [Riccia sorocarpa]|uniref:Endonuclease/exonuclease/phosphatase domain-containing protein n=1 Tax=Riccia sorocarpa TaxID=122646 RepID=A0ABD3GIG3_9MARC
MVTWNVRGVSRPEKAKIVKTWLQNKIGEARVIALQELKSVLNTYRLKGAEWIHHIKELEHHHTRRGSDHVPVSMTVVLNTIQPRRDSYFKMDVHALQDPEVRRKVQEAWENEPDKVRDDRRRWARGWCRLKSVLRSVRDLRELERKEEGPLEEEMAWRRERITESRHRRRLKR